MLGKPMRDVHDVQISSVRELKYIVGLIGSGCQKLIYPFIHRDYMWLRCLKAVISGVLHHDEPTAEVNRTPFEVNDLVVAQHRGYGEYDQVAEPLMWDRSQKTLKFFTGEEDRTLGRDLEEFHAYKGVLCQHLPSDRRLEERLEVAHLQIDPYRPCLPRTGNLEPLDIMGGVAFEPLVPQDLQE